MKTIPAYQLTLSAMPKASRLGSGLVRAALKAAKPGCIFLGLFIAGLNGSQVAAQNSTCSPTYFEYRSCSGKRQWCGFYTFVPVSPPTKYRTKTRVSKTPQKGTQYPRTRLTTE